MYQQAAPQQDAQGYNPNPGNGGDQGYYDADYEVVDDDK